MKITKRQLRRIIQEAMIQRQSGLSDILSQMRGHDVGDDATYAQGYQDGSVRAPFPHDASDDYAAGYEDGIADSGHTHPLSEAMLHGPDPYEWAEKHGLQVELDNLGQPIIYIDDEFAQSNDLPDGANWDVERADDDSGWVIYTGEGMPDPYGEDLAGGLDDLDDIGIQYRGY